MSTDRKRLNSAIQRIAREDPEIRKLLDDFRNSGGKPSESATSGSGAEDRQICCDGSTGGGGANPGSGTNDPNENPQDGIDPDDPAKISDNLTGVTDCDTGQAICFSGSDWIPPERWDSPTDPPPVPEYDPDYYFEAPDGTRFNSSYEYCIYRKDPNWKFVKTSRDPSGDPIFFCSYENTNTGTSPTITVFANECSGEAVCDEEPPVVEAWPEDGCVNLAVKGGKIVGSKFDPENDGSYSAPRDEVELCDEFGNKFKLSGSASGGWKTINPLNPDDGYLYDSSGKQIARISESEYSDPTM